MENLLLSDSTNKTAISHFITQCEEVGTRVRSFCYYRDRDNFAFVSIPPHHSSHPTLVYSLSKSFTSVCVGIAESEGLLSLEENIGDIFADKLPDNPDERLFRMTIEDCLTMQSGHDRCVMPAITHMPDPVREFLTYPVAYEPGTRFVYSTAATYICGAVIERRSGMPLVDYLYDRVLKHMEIQKPHWARCADGSCKGGTGLYVILQDLMKFAVMLRDNGAYNGRQIVPLDYLKKATTPKSYDVEDQRRDWHSGYGYQFWMNSGEGYRGDGAYGQLVMVFPERGSVFCMLAESTDMQAEVSAVFELIKDIEGISTIDQATLAGCTNSLRTPAVSVSPVLRKNYKAAINIAGITGISFAEDSNILDIALETNYGTQHIKCGNGKFIHNTPHLKNLRPSTINDHIYDTQEQLPVFASYHNDNGRLHVTLIHSDLPHTQVWSFTDSPEGAMWDISLRIGVLNNAVTHTLLIHG